MIAHDANVHTIAPPRAACRLTVVIPARNEASYISEALAALTRQRTIGGGPLASDVFDIIVLANNCSDATATIARERAARTRNVPIYVIENDFRADEAHIGAARKFVMDLAAARFLAAGKPYGIIASTDSDTIVDVRWIAWTLREALTADAVAGHVAIAPADQARLLPAVRRLYTRELAYRQSVAELEALIDPVPEDPMPRHNAFVGASFAVSAQAYFAAGTLPPRKRLEDLHFSHALRRIDARIRHSTFVRATTSARIAARVDGGFGTFMASLHECGARGERFRVEDPHQTLAVFERRAALRRLWNARQCGADLTRLAQRISGTHHDWPLLLANAATFGIFYERVAALGAALKNADVSVDNAIDTLRAVSRQRRSMGTIEYVQ